MAMVRRLFMILAALLTCTSIATYIWVSRTPRRLFTHQLAPTRRLTVRLKDEGLPDKVTLVVTYHKEPAFGMVAVANQTIARSPEPPTFQALYDSQSGMHCAFDNENAGFLFMYDEHEDDLWDTTRHSGWSGTTKEFWEEKLQQLLKKGLEIPYKTLPTPRAQETS